MASPLGLTLATSRSDADNPVCAFGVPRSGGSAIAWEYWPPEGGTPNKETPNEVCESESA
jgi:hypothetical protein